MDKKMIILLIIIFVIISLSGLYIYLYRDLLLPKTHLNQRERIALLTKSEETLMQALEHQKELTRTLTVAQAREQGFIIGVEMASRYDASYLVPVYSQKVWEQRAYISRMYSGLLLQLPDKEAVEAFIDNLSDSSYYARIEPYESGLELDQPAMVRQIVLRGLIIQLAYLRIVSFADSHIDDVF